MNANWFLSFQSGSEGSRTFFVKASLSVSIIHELFLPFRAAKRSVLVDHFETISNYFHQVNQSLEAYVEIFHMIPAPRKLFDWLDSKGDENITIVSTACLFICFDRRLCKTTWHYTADKVTPIQMISNRKIYILRHEFPFLYWWISIFI